MTEANAPARLTPLVAAARWAELFLIFFATPAAFAAYVDPQRRFDFAFEAVGLESILDPGMPRFRVLLPALTLLAIIFFVVLLCDKTFKNRELWNLKPALRESPRILATFLTGGLLMIAAAWLLDEFTTILTRPDGTSGFFYLPREFPVIVAVIAVLYPWLSCYPQEVLYRAFFFHRYEPILPNTPTMITVNAAAFIWLHAPFWSLPALLLTVPGGFLFAWTYTRTRSTLAVTLEHALFGWWAFTVGLGYFVFAGAIGR